MYLNTEPRMEQAIELAKEFRKGTGYDLMICGGFIRDVYFNKPHRDIDIYFCASNMDEYSEFFFGSFSWDRAVIYEKSDDEYDHQSVQAQDERLPRKELEEKYPLLFGNGQTVNLIALRTDHNAFVETAEDVINKFNIGLSQIGVDLSAAGVRVHTTSGFWQDANNRRVTVLRTDWGFIKTAAGMRKYAVKYPDFKQYLDGVGRYDEKEFLSMEHI